MFVEVSEVLDIISVRLLLCMIQPMFYLKSGILYILTLPPKVETKNNPPIDYIIVYNALVLVPTSYCFKTLGVILDRLTATRAQSSFVLFQTLTMAAQIF